MSTSANEKAGPRTDQRPQAGPPRTGPAARRVKLTLSRVDPWSIFKMAFLLSVAVGIAIVAATTVLWTVLDGMGIFADIDRVASDVAGNESGLNVLEYLAFGNVLSLAIVIAVVDVFLLTVIATLGALLYNLASSLVGGVHVTLTDD